MTKKKNFAGWHKSGLLFLDGATGSNLQKQGMPVGVCPELWITEHEEIMSGLPESISGSRDEYSVCPDLTANRIKLKGIRSGGPDRRTLNHKLVEISKRAADGRRW